jgi:uncharacterized DUF497 family protein
MPLVFVGFDWNKGNRDKCQRHGVPLTVIESLFHGSLAVFPDPSHSRAEERFKAIGSTENGRNLLIVFTLRRQEEDILIRPISARYMHRKEVEHYEEAFARAEKR